MSQLLDSIIIALQAVWANKLRSFMTVLGNIVAVTSIVTVVSLIQGMNSMVSTAILTDVGGDTFVVQRTPAVRTLEEEERTRNNPLITRDEADAIKAFSPAVQSVMVQANFGAAISYGTQELEAIQIQGVTSEYLNFSTFDAERGRMMSAVEVDRGQPVTLIGWDVADRLFGQTNPIDKTVRIAGVPFRVVGVSKQKGAFFGNSQDNFAVIPLDAHMRLFGARQSLSLVVKPTSPDALQAAMDDATVALRTERRLKPSEPDNFGLFTSAAS
jgi:putative ABC transport system permease protein